MVKHFITATNTVSNITSNSYHYNRHLKLNLWITFREGGNPGRNRSSICTIHASKLFGATWGVSEFQDARCAPSGTTGHGRPTFINGRTSGVWEFEATGVAAAAARPAGHCTMPRAQCHRRSLNGVWGVCPP